MFMAKNRGKALGQETVNIQPSDALMTLINLENEFPRDAQPLTEIQKDIGIYNLYQTTEFVEDFLKDKPFCTAYIQAQPPFNDTVIPHPPTRYERLRVAVLKLRLLAGADLYELQNNLILRQELHGAVYFEVDANGRAVFTGGDLFQNAIAGALLERIRACEVCGKVFYAVRKDKRGCSDKCGNVIRQRSWYSEIPEKRKQQYLEARKIKRRKARNG